MSAVPDDPSARNLQDALVTAAAAGAIAAPVAHSRLIELIVETAMQVTAAEAAALFLLDEERQELLFAVALGPHAAAVRDLRVPLGHGVAGLVAVSGQPMIVADAQHDPRQATDIARKVGYTPRSLLCVPLLSNDRVIGVLEMLDKRDARGFEPTDMHTLALFARQAAVAIEQSSTSRSLTGLLTAALAGLAPAADTARAREEAAASVDALQGTPLYDSALELAGLVREIVWHGEAERRLCETVLRALVEYVRARPAPGRES